MNSIKAFAARLFSFSLILPLLALNLHDVPLFKVTYFYFLPLLVLKVCDEWWYCHCLKS